MEHAEDDDALIERTIEDGEAGNDEVAKVGGYLSPSPAP